MEGGRGREEEGGEERSSGRGEEDAFFRGRLGIERLLGLGTFFSILVQIARAQRWEDEIGGKVGKWMQFLSA